MPYQIEITPPDGKPYRRAVLSLDQISYRIPIQVDAMPVAYRPPSTPKAEAWEYAVEQAAPAMRDPVVVRCTSELIDGTTIEILYVPFSYLVRQVGMPQDRKPTADELIEEVNRRWGE